MKAHFMCIHGVQATPTILFLLEIPKRKANGRERARVRGVKLNFKCPGCFELW